MSHQQSSSYDVGTGLLGLNQNIVSGYFGFGPVVQKEMLFKDTSYLQLWQPIHSALEGIMGNIPVKLF